MTKCKVCKSKLNYTLCSNSKCRSWKKYRQQGTKWIAGDGLTSNNPIIIYCPTCSFICRAVKANETYCNNHKQYMPYNFVKNMWYQMEGDYYQYIIQYINIPKFWNVETQIIIPLQKVPT